MDKSCHKTEIEAEAGDIQEGGEITEDLINNRREKYVLSQKHALLAKDGDRIFF